MTEAEVTTPDTDRREPRLLRAIDAIGEACGYLSGVCIALAALVIGYAVTVRAFGNSTIWQTELTVYLLIFVTFVGGAYGLKHGSHVNVDLVTARLPGRAAAALELVAMALSVALLTVVLVRSAQTWWLATDQGYRSGSAWNPPLTFPYAVLPLGMALLVLQYLALAWRRIRALRGEQDGAGSAGEEDA